MRTHLQIAIDGPAGVGKSTTGERLARQLDYIYVDTGAFYRTLTYAALREGVAPDDMIALNSLARRIRIQISAPMETEGQQYSVWVDGEDITSQLRTPAVEAAVSEVSSHEPVRVTLIQRMREMADERGVVMVGRDIGTVVLEDADLKIFLTTSLKERAWRRWRDLMAKYGADAPSLATVESDIARRDAIDAPHTRVALDAIELNNDHLEADEVVEYILQTIRDRERPE
jgi:cytidylate kinase